MYIHVHCNMCCTFTSALLIVGSLSKQLSETIDRHHLHLELSLRLCNPLGLLHSLQEQGGREREREGEREGSREEGREGGREGEREERRERGRKGGKEEGREGRRQRRGREGWGEGIHRKEGRWKGQK